MSKLTRGGDRIKSGLILFYLSRGHEEGEATNLADRHLQGDSTFVANEPPEQPPAAAIEFKRVKKL